MNDEKWGAPMYGQGRNIDLLVTLITVLGRRLWVLFQEL